MGSERARREGDPEEVSGIVPQSLVELFRLLEERGEAGGGREKGEAETWSVRVGYLQVGADYMGVRLLLRCIHRIRCTYEAGRAGGAVGNLETF